MLELFKHHAAVFLTLTFDEEHYPDDASVSVRTAQTFLKRLRSAVAPGRLRYYIVGEYGERSGRAHYHALVYGLGRPGNHIEVKELKRKGPCPCVVCVSWGQGGVHIGEVTEQSVAYTVSYVVKRMTDESDDRLRGRAPEFARMSLRPGIGALAVGELVDVVARPEVARTYSNFGDLPGVLRVLGKKWPIGRYLRGKIAEQLGLARGGKYRRRLVIDYPHVLKLWAQAKDVGASTWSRQQREKRLQHARNAAARDSIRRVRGSVI